MYTMKTEPQINDRYFVFDLDNTLRNNDWRVKKYLKEPETPDWDAYFRAAVNDTPIEYMVDFFKKLKSLNRFKLVILTGHSSLGDAKFFQEHQEWLEKHGLVADIYYERPHGCFDNAELFKLRAMQELNITPENCIEFIDDEKAIVKAVRKYGFNTNTVQFYKHRITSDSIDYSQIK